MAKKKKLTKAERKEARLRKGKQWLLTYTGSPKKMNKHYRERFHQDMIYFTYGLAILANTDHLHLTETELREAFRREFHALIAIYGKPAKLPEFAVRAGVVL